MRRFAKAGMLMALALAMTAAVTVPAGAAGDAEQAPAARCDEGHWPATVQGQPETLTSGGRAGYYVWHDPRGWHLRTTTPHRSPHTFSGTIVSADDIELVHQFRDEGRDSVTVRGNKLTFTFVTYNGVDGVDIKVGCTAGLAFSLKAFDRLVPVSRIWLGENGTARSNPFRIPRVG